LGMKEMTRRIKISRRRLLSASAATSAFWLAGSGRTAGADWLRRVLDVEETVNRTVQRAIVPVGAQGRQYTRADISPHFKSNGTHHPANPVYQTLASNNFVDWRLEIAGLVDRPVRLSLAAIRAMPSVTQITRHDCVE